MTNPRSVMRFYRFYPPFVRTCNASSVLTSAMPIRFVNMNGATEFSTLFDQYRIDRVVATFSLVDDPGHTLRGALYYAVDLDDSTEVNQDIMLQKGDVKFRNLSELRNKSLTVSWKPHFNTALNTTGTNVASAGNSSGWVDMSALEVAHHGLKYNIVNESAQQVEMQINVRVYFSVRGVR